MYGWVEEEAVGQNIFMRLPAASPMLEEEGVAIFAELSRGMQYEGQYAMVAKGGAVVEVVVTNTPIMDEAGRLVGIIGCSSDVGELKRKEAEILRLNSELEQRVAERTRQLEDTNARLLAEIQEHLLAKENLQAYARVRPPPPPQGSGLGRGVSCGACVGRRTSRRRGRRFWSSRAVWRRRWRS